MQHEDNEVMRVLREINEQCVAQSIDDALREWELRERLGIPHDQPLPEGERIKMKMPYGKYKGQAISGEVQE